MKKIPGPLAPPRRRRPNRKMTARSYSCTTCHVIVKQGYNQLSEAEDREEDLLDRAPGLTPTSRLGCQAVIEDEDAELTVVIPRYTINQQVGESREH